MVNENQKYIAWAFYALLIAGCGFWLYQLAIIDVKPSANLLFSTQDTRDALVVIIFGLIAVLFVFVIGFFLLKLISNLYIEGISSVFPKISDSIIKSISCLIMLGVAFLFIENVKATGLTAYQQVTEVLEVATQHDEAAVEGYKKKVEMERKAMEGDFSGFFGK